MKMICWLALGIGNNACIKRAPAGVRGRLRVHGAGVPGPVHRHPLGVLAATGPEAAGGAGQALPGH